MNRTSLILTILLASACSMSAFEDRRDDAWSDSNGSVDLESADYGVAVAGVTTDKLGATIAVLGTNPIGLGVVAYDGSGGLEQYGLELPQLEDLSSTARPTLVGATETIGSDGDAVALVALGGLGVDGEIFLFDVGSGPPEQVATLSGADCGTELGENLGTHMSFAHTNGGTPDTLDLVALRGNELFLFPDIDIDAAPGEHECHRCVVQGAVGPLVGMTTLNGAVSSEEEEILISIAGGISLLDANTIVNAIDDVCLTLSLLFPPQRSMGMESDLGAHMAVGYADDNEFAEVALSSPQEGKVYVVSNFDQSSGAASIGQASPLEFSAGTSAFGDGPMVFFDIDVPSAGEDEVEGDELMIGVPTASPEGVQGAGQVFVFKFSNSDDSDGWEERAILHDSKPEAGQNYGRALGGAEFVGEDGEDTDLLIVGAQNETFSLFRTLVTSIDPR